MTGWNGAPTPRVPSVSGSGDDVHLRDGWAEALPQNVIGRLSGDPEHDQALLDAWVEDTTSGSWTDFPPRSTRGP